MTEPLRRVLLTKARRYDLTCDSCATVAERRMATAKLIVQAPQLNDHGAVYFWCTQCADNAEYLINGEDDEPDRIEIKDVRNLSGSSESRPGDDGQSAYHPSVDFHVPPGFRH